MFYYVYYVIFLTVAAFVLALIDTVTIAGALYQPTDAVLYAAVAFGALQVAGALYTMYKSRERRSPYMTEVEYQRCRQAACLYKYYHLKALVLQFFVTLGAAIIAARYNGDPTFYGAAAGSVSPSADEFLALRAVTLLALFAAACTFLMGADTCNMVYTINAVVSRELHAHDQQHRSASHGSSRHSSDDTVPLLATHQQQHQNGVHRSSFVGGPMGVADMAVMSQSSVVTAAKAMTGGGGRQ